MYADGMWTGSLPTTHHLLIHPDFCHHPLYPFTLTYFALCRVMLFNCYGSICLCFKNVGLVKFSFLILWWTKKLFGADCRYYSRLSKPLCISFFCETQRNIYWRMLISSFGFCWLLLCLLSLPLIVTNILPNILFLRQRRKSVIQAWNYMRVRQWWTLPYSYLFKSQLFFLHNSSFIRWHLLHPGELLLQAHRCCVWMVSVRQSGALWTQLHCGVLLFLLINAFSTFIKERRRETSHFSLMLKIDSFSVMDL